MYEGSSRDRIAAFKLALDRTREGRVNHDDRWESDHGADELCDPPAFDFVERLEDVDDLSDNQIRHEQLVRGCEERACSTRLSRRIAGQMSNQDVGGHETVRSQGCSIALFAGS